MPSASGTHHIILAMSYMAVEHQFSLAVLLTRVSLVLAKGTQRLGWHAEGASHIVRQAERDELCFLERETFVEEAVELSVT